MIENTFDLRAAIVDYLRAELVGPKGGETETVIEPPFKRYTTGIIFPQDEKHAEVEKDDVQDDGPTPSDGSLEEPIPDDTVYLANQNLPACMGLSFFVNIGESFDLSITGASYVKEEQTLEPQDEKERETALVWRRVPLKETITGVNPATRKGSSPRSSLFQGHADLHVAVRPSAAGYIVTVTVINNRQKNRDSMAEDCLHQVVIRVEMVGEARLGAYPRSHRSIQDLDAEILDLLYLKNTTYGIGHGCSVMWDLDHDNPRWIASEYLPAAVVPAIKYELENSSGQVLSVERLAKLGTTDETTDLLFNELHGFVEQYGRWIDSLRAQRVTVTAHLTAAFDEIISRLDKTKERMERGVNVLRHDDQVLRAFRLANEAMLLQRIHSGPDFAGGMHPRSRSRTTTVTQGGQPLFWRPFQLAFILLSLSSIAFEEDPDRDVVDLIWFPTGGGKTEAYLAVTAFLMFYRRLRYANDGGGTAVIMRYTLRLLTTQQLQRASTLVCACEVIRNREADDLGEEQFTIGLWVGGGTTPNTYQQAVDRASSIYYDDTPKSPFQIDRCPWCGTGLVPPTREEDPEVYGFHATNQSFRLNCPTPDCDFHESIPVLVVDQQLYDFPPTILLATVDKFARLPWAEQVSVFFGSEGNRAPDLIIQDELHLISGPLGTIVGLYETAVDGLIQMHGVRPKIIASTATIRRANDQIRSLYNRDVNLFPPSGTTSDDSYFARYDYSRPGRLYLGVLGLGHTPATDLTPV